MPACQVFGWLTIALGVVALCGVVANISGKNLGGHSLTPLASVVVLSISVGLGLIFRFLLYLPDLRSHFYRM